MRAAARVWGKANHHIIAVTTLVLVLLVMVMMMMTTMATRGVWLEHGGTTLYRASGCGHCQRWESSR